MESEGGDEVEKVPVGTDVFLLTLPSREVVQVVQLNDALYLEIIKTNYVN